MEKIYFILGALYKENGAHISFDHFSLLHIEVRRQGRIRYDYIVCFNF